LKKKFYVAFVVSAEPGKSRIEQEKTETTEGPGDFDHRLMPIVLLHRSVSVNKEPGGPELSF